MTAALLQQQRGSGPRVEPLTILRRSTPNFGGTRHGFPPVAVVLHTMSGTLAGCDSWFANPASQVSAHFGIGLNGAIHQYVRLEHTAWANGRLELPCPWGPYATAPNPNYETISIETEDQGLACTPVSDAQYEAVRRLIVEVLLPLHPVLQYLVGHHQISPRSKPNCPGSRWMESGRFAQLAGDTGLEAIA